MTATTGEGARMFMADMDITTAMDTVTDMAMAIMGTATATATAITGMATIAE